jgi:hypothetical protein
MGATLPIANWIAAANPARMPSLRKTASRMRRPQNRRVSISSSQSTDQFEPLNRNGIAASSSAEAIVDRTIKAIRRLIRE